MKNAVKAFLITFITITSLRAEPLDDLVQQVQAINLAVIDPESIRIGMQAIKSLRAHSNECAQAVYTEALSPIQIKKKIMPLTKALNVISKVLVPVSKQSHKLGVFLWEFQIEVSFLQLASMRKMLLHEEYSPSMCLHAHVETVATVTLEWLGQLHRRKQASIVSLLDRIKTKNTEESCDESKRLEAISKVDDMFELALVVGVHMIDYIWSLADKVPGDCDIDCDIV